MTKEQKFRYIQLGQAKPNWNRNQGRRLAKLRKGDYFWSMMCSFPARFLSDDTKFRYETYGLKINGYRYDFVRTVTPRELAKFRSELKELIQFYNQ